MLHGGMLRMPENTTRNDIEIANESMVMTYLNILKYAKHHYLNSEEDPYDIADHVFINWLKVTISNSQEADNDQAI